MTQLNLNEQFILSCKDNDLEKVKNFLTNPTYKNQVDIHYLEDSGFLQACKQGHIELVEYLLTSSDLSEHANIHAQEDYGLTLAAEKEYTEIMDFLLHSPKLNNHINLFDNFIEVNNVIDTMLGNMQDQRFADNHGYDYGNKLLKFLVCDCGLEKNTNQDLEPIITELVEYNDGYYEIYKKNKETYDLQQQKNKLKLF